MAGFSEGTKSGTQVAHPEPPLAGAERKLAYFFIGTTLCIGAFLFYGGRNDTAAMIRASKPLHVLHHDYVLTEKKRSSSI